MNSLVILGCFCHEYWSNHESDNWVVDLIYLYRCTVRCQFSSKNLLFTYLSKSAPLFQSVHLIETYRICIEAHYEVIHVFIVPLLRNQLNENIHIHPKQFHHRLRLDGLINYFSAKQQKVRSSLNSSAHIEPKLLVNPITKQDFVFSVLRVTVGANTIQYAFNAILDQNQIRNSCWSRVADQVYNFYENYVERVRRAKEFNEKKIIIAKSLDKLFRNRTDKSMTIFEFIHFPSMARLYFPG